MEQFISRRKALKKTLSAGLGLASFSALSQLILSCEKKNHDNQIKATSLFINEPCAVDTNLSAQDHARRNALKYVDKTPISTRTCDNCKLYTSPSPQSFCGGCKVVPGPIHPKGFCYSWYARM
jgi:hypothetical protein